ncbi:amino acid ABC transporter membrane protein 1 (PAAT family) [Advenella incenata]|uniref:Amino acid ABC transporter membrane protein 1 (PAAT family) n=1 Tax=Advenella incenata TaxID=267800 RepID=A0A4Q7VRV7_9BURK|nr:amino acid ABC transporter permease [Advenella incenata]RZT99260.1 amino acid ABC transporter membrane protein 1 (PAAT family) [Advenella incenata]
MRYDFNFAGLLPYWHTFLEGALLTLELTLASTVFGLAIGIFCSIGTRSRYRWINRVCAVYVETIRNTPFLVQIFIFYFGLSSIGLQMPAAVAAVIAMVINVGAYSSEIIRAGMDAIPRGQIEAAECLGLSRPRIYWHVIMLPAFEKVYPSITSQFILMMLMSSITSQISTEELTAVANNVQSETFLSLESYIVVAALYLLLAVVLRVLFWLAEQLLFRRKRVIAQAQRRSASMGNAAARKRKAVSRKLPAVTIRG